MTMRTCPTCGGLTPARFQSCGHCGTRLVADHAVEEIRRFATVVNSDLKGSTALGERLDPETLREVLTLYFDEMQAVFESHGGTIEKIIGDAIVAVFGVPVRREDDALRAVEAAAESQRVLANLNDRLDATWGVRLVVRTGIATGEVVFGEASLGQHVLAGDTMRISSAMEQNAPPLEVLVAGSTIDLVRDQVEVEEMPAVTPKGMDVAVAAYRLVSVTPRERSGHAVIDAVMAGLRLCPACGEENPESFRHCGMCGATLTLVAPARESRKTVTLVFADPKPTTIDGSAPSPEALRDVMTHYFDAMRAALERHGGTVEKFIGDAVMAVFGLPVRHEDDALRAVRAAADMQAALPDLNDGFRAQWGLELRNHIGVNTGEVIAGDAALGQRLVTGDAVNTAARLEQAAGPQEIVLGELTYRLARDQIDVEAIEPLHLKGKAEPVPAYRLVGVRERPADRSAHATPFVGREAEMAALRDSLLDAEGHHAGRLVVLVGDAGVGKSRLIREFAGSIAREAQVVRSRCLPYGDGITFWPIGEIVRAATGITDEDDIAEALAKITARLAEEPSTRNDAPEIADRIGAAIGLSTTQYQMPELFYGIRRFLETLARQQPLVLIVDDVHVAAPAFLELVDHLLEAVAEVPILLLATARHELIQTHADWSASHATQRITLEPLTSADAVSIIDELLSGLDATVRERIVDAAEGNPLYVEQITSMLVETGAIRRMEDRWVSTASSGEVSIPPTIQALVAARLDALGPEERAVVEPASVIGLSFPRDALVELVEEAVRPSIPEHLGSLSEKQFVRAAATGDDEEVYRFGHLVIKDTTYGSLLKRIRVMLHERFVDWAERVNRERGRETEFEEIHGYHLEQAYRYRTELGPIDDRGRETARRAAEKLGNAGHRALGRGDMPAASDLLLRAAALLEDDDPVRIEILPEAAEALMEQGGDEHDVAVQILEQALDASRRIGDQRLEARSALMRVMALLDTSDPSLASMDVAAELDRIVRLFEERQDVAGLARAWRIACLFKGLSGRFDEAAEAANRSVEYARSAGDARLAARGAALYAQTALLGPSPVDEAVPVCERLLVDVRGDRRAESQISGSLSLLLAMQGSFDRARALYVQARRLLEELGPSVSASSTSTESSGVEFRAGDPVAAEALLRRDYDELGVLGEKYLRSTVGGFLAEAVYQQARFEDAEELVQVVREIAAEDDTVTQMLWRTVEAKLVARRGRQTEAIALAEEALALAREVDSPALVAGVLMDVGETHYLCGDQESAGPPWREALRLFVTKGDLASAFRTRERLGLLGDVTPSEAPS